MKEFFGLFSRNEPNQVTVLGGTITGEKWLEQRKAGQENLQFWVLGYLSGLAVQSGKNFLFGVTPKSVVEAMDRRCELKPQLCLVEIANDLVTELEK